MLMMVVLLACMLFAVTAQAAHPARDWNAFMPLPTEEQLSRAGTARSPYIVFYPRFSRQTGMTAFAMDLRMDHDPNGTYICPIVWDVNTSRLEREYARVTTDYGDTLGGYFGFQVLEDGTRAVIMTLWNAFCEDENGNVTQVKARLLFPEGMDG